MKYFYTILISIAGIINISSQEIVHSNIVKNEYVVQFNNDLDAERFNKKIAADSDYTLRCIFKDLNIYSLINISSDKKLDIKKLKSKHKEIKNISENRRVKSRRIPNDPLFDDQFNLDIIGVEQLWDLATGGITYDNRNIVVAVIDDGFDVFHEDLRSNIWQNENDIYNNEVDDDGNGYVDDTYGPNIPNKNGYHIEDDHGTSVAGIIGAAGNNSVGVTGINWNIEILPIGTLRSGSASGSTHSDIIEGYNYAYELRKLYNETNGEQGDYVVVTNFSAGVDETFPSELPMWCEVYDQLGSAGILSVSAVTNSDVNIELVGDMPSLCESDFLLTVTNTDYDDQKIRAAGFGEISVDIGAPGENALTTNTNNSYETFDGTSSACPHVAGVAALMYSMPCTNFVDLSISAPEQAALLLKKYILEGAIPIADLQGRTVSGGRLNASNTFIQMDNDPPVIQNCPQDITITEADTTFRWEEIRVVDDCGDVQVMSSHVSGNPFRFGTTEVEIIAVDRLNQQDICRFSVTREGTSGISLQTLEIKNSHFDSASNNLFVTVNTGSFEAHIVEIYNTLGQKMTHHVLYPATGGDNIFAIPLTQSLVGMHFLQVSKAGGSITQTRKIVF